MGWCYGAHMHTALLVLHFLGLALGVGAGFAQLTLTLATRELSPAERSAFALRALALAKNGSYGLLLLIVSGASMTVLRGVGATFQWGGPAFHAKLTLVVPCWRARLRAVRSRALVAPHDADWSCSAISRASSALGIFRV